MIKESNEDAMKAAPVAYGVAVFAKLHAMHAMARIADLAERVSEIENKGVKYRGVYQRSDEYQRGDLVTHEGSMWHANRDTRSQPGASADWQLAVKAGRDAK